jgi:hypothetical protein
MAAFATYSTTASANVTFGAINIAENCPAANVNDALRAIAAEGRQLYDLVAAINTSNLMPKSGGAFTGNITKSGSGGYLYHVTSSMSGGKIYTQTVGTALPSSPEEGTMVLFY